MAILYDAQSASRYLGVLADDVMRWLNLGMLDSQPGREGLRLMTREGLLDFDKRYHLDLRAAQLRARIVRARHQGVLDL